MPASFWSFSDGDFIGIWGLGFGVCRSLWSATCSPTLDCLATDKRQLGVSIPCGVQTVPCPKNGLACLNSGHTQPRSPTQPMLFMTGFGIFGLLSGILQLSVPSYSLRLVRRFGTQRV